MVRALYDLTAAAPAAKSITRDPPPTRRAERMPAATYALAASAASRTDLPRARNAAAAVKIAADTNMVDSGNLNGMLYMVNKNIYFSRRGVFSIDLLHFFKELGCLNCSLVQLLYHIT